MILAACSDIWSRDATSVVTPESTTTAVDRSRERGKSPFSRASRRRLSLGASVRSSLSVSLMARSPSYELAHGVPRGRLHGIERARQGAQGKPHGQETEADGDGEADREQG